MEFIEIPVKERPERGTAATRRLRRSGHVPGVLYGLRDENLPLAISLGDLQRFLRTGSHLVALCVGSQTRDAILREVQQDPVSDQILHVDFQRVDKDAELEDHVPVTFKGTPAGTREGGMFQALMSHLTLRARPRDLPDEIVLDVAPLQVGDSIHVRDVAVPAGVTLVDPPGELVAHVVIVRGEVETAPAAAEPTTAEPEVIGRAAERTEESAEG